MAAKRKTDSTVRCFEVGEPRLHEKGYTIYKVILKTINVEAPDEDVVETVFWKRYNDFKKLYKIMSTLHKALHRAEEFPPFARAKVFGRFDDQVIAERQQSGQDLLNFVAQRSYLVKSKAFKDFCEGGHSITVNPHSDPILEPVRLDQEDNVSIGSDTDISSVASSSVDLTGQEMPHLPEPMERSRDDGTQDLGGVWQFRQAVDNISLDDEEGDAEMGGEAGLSSRSSEVDLSLFDPMHAGTSQVPDSGDTFSNLWLLSALSEFNVEGDSIPLSASEDGGSQGALDSDQSESDKMGKGSSKVDKRTDGVGSAGVFKSLQPGAKSNSGEFVDLSILNLPDPPRSDFDEASESNSKSVADEFDPLKPNKKVTCGHGDAGFSLTDSVSSLPENTTEGSDPSSAQADPLKAQVQAMKDGGKPASLSATSSPSRSPRRQYLPVELGEKGKYIVTAARQISLAQQCEANGNYHMAFTYYKNSVGVLLTGVQGDDNAGRREVVRRKTARYLMKAEEIYKKYLVAKGAVDDNRWDTGQSTRHELTQELDPNVALLQGPVSELSNYRVLGVIDSVLLTLDKNTNCTFVMKILHKSSIKTPMPNIVPTNCPYMVKLHKFYETENAIYLLLQHATGGKLWTYVSGFLNQQQEHLFEEVFSRNGNNGNSKSNVYSGQCLHEASQIPLDSGKVKNLTSTPHKGVPHITRSHELHDIAGILNQSKQDQNRDVAAVMNIAERGEGEGSSEPDVETGECRNSYTNLLMEGSELKEVSTPKSEKEDTESITKTKPDLETAENIDERRYSDYLGLDDSQDSLSFHRPATENSSKPTSTSSNDNNEEPSGTTRYISIESAEKFEELLKKSTKPSLENFSINSFDSDSAPCSRFDSTASDYIESIPEVNEGQLKDLVVGPSPSAEEVFLTLGESGSDLVTRPINRHLQKVITEDSPMPKMQALKMDTTNITLEGDIGVELVERGGSTSEGLGKNVIDSPPERLVQHDPILGLDVSTKGPDSSSFTGSFEEPSIYDVHRHTDTDSGSINLSIDLVIEDEKKPGTLDPTSPTEGEDGKPALDEKRAFQKDKDLQHPEIAVAADKRVSSPETSPVKVTVGSGSRDRKSSGSISPKKPGRPPLTRMQSGERSLETEMRRSRKRTLSGVFGELDLAEDGEREVVHLPEGCVRQWAAEIVTAIDCLHKMGIVCRDLRPGNILLGDRGHILLTYFSHWNCVLPDTDSAAHNTLYSAPEIGSIFDMTPACDWWSLGVILFELLTGKSLASSYPGGITSHTTLTIPDHVSPEAQSLLHELLRFNPSERLGSGISGADDIRHHPFFADITWTDLQG